MRSSVLGLKRGLACKMMTHRLLCVGAIGLTVISCGKIRELAGKAKRAAETGVSAALDSAKKGPAPADPKLQALVDQTPEGAIFRKDLPFPEQVEVREDRRLTFDGARIVVKSAIGNQSSAFSGTRFFTTHYERAGNRLDISIESAGFAEPEVAAAANATQAKGANAKADPLKAEPAKAVPAKGAEGKPTLSKVEQAKADQVAAGAADAAAVPDELSAIKELSRCKIAFVHNGKAWKPEHSNDFKLVVWGKNLAPHLAANCIDAGVSPRGYWFGKRRLKPGDTVPLSGPALWLLLGDGATGALVLKLESFEASGGHPCGVFALTGNYREAAVPGPDGEVSDQEVSITSGKVWLSLIYPIVIREQLETVQTLVAGASSGHSSHIQGKVTVALTREWSGSPAPASK